MFVIFGASSGLGKELSYVAAENNHSCYLISRDERDLHAISNDLNIKLNVSAHYSSIDMSIEDPEFTQIIDGIRNAMSNTDDLNIYFTVGLISDYDGINEVSDNYKNIFNANFGSIALFIEKLVESNLRKNIKSINFFGSIASARGRSKNIMYSAAKKALISYYESLRHGFADIKINFFMVGYMKTRMIDGKRLLFPAVEPKRFASYIIKNIDRDLGLIYYPSFWLIVVNIVKMIPWRIYRKINF